MPRAAPVTAVPKTASRERPESVELQQARSEPNCAVGERIRLRNIWQSPRG